MLFSRYLCLGTDENRTGTWAEISTFRIRVRPYLKYQWEVLYHEYSFDNMKIIVKFVFYSTFHRMRPSRRPYFAISWFEGTEKIHENLQAVLLLSH
jgi:hypothetical protein